MACGAIIVVAGEESFPDRDYFCTHAGDVAAQNLFAATERKRRKIVAAGGEGFYTVVVAADADHLLDALVIGRELVVGERPIDVDAVEAVFAEVGGRVAEDDGVPVNGAASEDTDAVDADVVGLLVADGVFEVGGIEELLLFAAKAAELHVGGPAVGAEAAGFDFGSGFEEDDFRAAFAEFLGDDSACGAGPDDADVVEGSGHAPGRVISYGAG